MRKHFFNEDYFKIIDTEDKAYWLGFITADGHISKSSQYNSYRLSISQSDIDKEHLEKFLKCIGANDIEVKTYDNNIGYSKNSNSKISRVTLNSLKMCMDLDKYNIHQNKSYDVRLPDINSDLMPHYLRGFFDGDGSYYCHYDEKNNRYRYSFEVVGASFEIMRQIREYLLSFGIKTNIYSRKSLSSGNELYRLMANSKSGMLGIINLLYSNAHIYLDRKYEKINEIKKIAV